MSAWVAPETGAGSAPGCTAPRAAGTTQRHGGRGCRGEWRISIACWPLYINYCFGHLNLKFKFVTPVLTVWGKGRFINRYMREYPCIYFVSKGGG